MNKELLPQFEFQERAHNMLLSRIADTNMKRTQLQSAYLARYKQILKNKKQGMVKLLKDRFQKLIKEENDTVSRKLRKIHIPTSSDVVQDATTSKRIVVEEVVSSPKY